MKVEIKDKIILESSELEVNILRTALKLWIERARETGEYVQHIKKLLQDIDGGIKNDPEIVKEINKIKE
jgi:hypothetical protein